MSGTGEVQKSFRHHFCCAGRRFHIWIVSSIALIIAIGLTVFFLFPRTPTTKFLSVALAQSSPIQVNSWTSGTAKLIVKYKVSNPNYISIDIQSLSFNATNALYGNGTVPFASGKNITGFTLPARGDADIKLPFAVTYDAKLDPKLQFAGDVAGSCLNNLVGGNDSFVADLKLVAEVNVLGSIKFAEDVQLQYNIMCPSFCLSFSLLCEELSPRKMKPITKVPPFARCIAIVLVLLLTVILMVFFLVPREPSVVVSGLSFDRTNTNGVVQISSLTSLSARLIMGLSITNNCYYPVTVEQLNFNATNQEYDSGRTPFAMGSNATAFTIAARSTYSFTYPFSIVYDFSKDSGMQFLMGAGTKCVAGALGGSGSGAQITANVVVATQYDALVINKGWLRNEMTVNVSC
ncbi:hypothetical protein HDU79_002839 [Rhizoclosmatium sp. JEL0117]|nr:hypothetical protein HDU79_002839 [Rhizoclosmatium sp. JEL0117]